MTRKRRGRSKRSNHSKRSKRSKHSKHSKRAVLRLRKRGGGVVGALFGEIVSPDMPDRWKKGDELTQKCMLANEHKYSSLKLIEKCGRTDALWNPSMMDQFNGATPVNLAFHYSNENSPDAP